MNPLKSAHKPQQRELLAHDASKWYRYHKVYHHKKSINKKLQRKLLSMSEKITYLPKRGTRKNRREEKIQQ